MRKLLVVTVACMFVFSVAALAGDKSASLEGFVSDSGCGVKNAKAGHGDCVKKCVEKGASLVFVDSKDKKVYTVENQDALKGHEGHEVTVTGHVNAEKNSIHVEEVKMKEGM